MRAVLTAMCHSTDVECRLSLSRPRPVSIAVDTVSKSDLGTRRDQILPLFRGEGGNARS